MSTFEEYAALARHLSELRRAGERDAAAEEAQRSAGQAGIDQLGHRLGHQEQRLHQLAPLAGRPVPSTAPVAPASVPAPVPGASGPWRPEVDDHPPLPAQTDQRALPSPLPAPVTGVPAPRPPAELDPAAELARAHQAADAADAAMVRMEELAQAPPLLPTLSPLARALVVYAGCAGAGVVLMFAMVLGSGVGVVDAGTLYAWMCAGLPAISFFAGWLLLGRFGKPPAVAGAPPRYVHFGFLICFVLLPIAYCAYLLVIRTLR